MRRIGDVAEHRQDHAEQIDDDEQAGERHEQLTVRPEIDAAPLQHEAGAVEAADPGRGADQRGLGRAPDMRVDQRAPGRAGGEQQQKSSRSQATLEHLSHDREHDGVEHEVAEPAMQQRVGERRHEQRPDRPAVAQVGGRDEREIDRDQPLQLRRGDQQNEVDRGHCRQQRERQRRQVDRRRPGAGARWSGRTKCHGGPWQGSEPGTQHSDFAREGDPRRPCRAALPLATLLRPPAHRRRPTRALQPES